jgi:uncharacterized membrane protein
MESRAKLFGHAVHPILIVFPLGLLSTAAIFDVIYLSTSNAAWAVVSFWMILSGVIGGLIAALFGLIDFLAIPAETRAKFIGLIHGLTNVAVTILFLLSWLTRYHLPETPTSLSLVLSFVGVALALLGGWLGGELVERLGVGVHDGANLNAPNSLRHPKVQKGL